MTNRGDGAGRCDAGDWLGAYRLAARRIRSFLTTRGEITPARLMRLATSALPRPTAARWLRTFRRNGWHDPDVRLSPGDGRIGSYAGAARPLVELALFGPGGQGAIRDAAHREQEFRRLRAEIVAHAQDFSALSAAAERAMNDPSVRADSELRGLLRTFIARQQADLYNKRSEVAQAEATARAASVEDARRAVESQRKHADSEVRRRALAAARNQFTDLRLRFEDRLAHYDGAGARHVLDELRALGREHDDIVTTGLLEVYVEKVKRLDQRSEAFRAQVESLATAAHDAAEKGDSDRALWIARRLAAIHDMLPEVLPTERYRALHEKVMSAVRHDEHREAFHELIQFERSVATDVKQLAGKVHRFHEISRREPHDSPLYREARAAFEQCVRSVIQRDEDWLAGVMLKLDTLLEDLEEERDHAVPQVEKFLENVRVALVRVRKEIIAIRAEDKARRSPPAG